MWYKVNKRLIWTPAFTATSSVTKSEAINPNITVNQIVIKWTISGSSSEYIWIKESSSRTYLYRLSLGLWSSPTGSITIKNGSSWSDARSISSSYINWTGNNTYTLTIWRTWWSLELNWHTTSFTYWSAEKTVVENILNNSSMMAEIIASNATLWDTKYIYS